MIRFGKTTKALKPFAAHADVGRVGDEPNFRPVTRMKRSDILGVVVEVFDVCGSEKEVDRPKHSPRQPPDIEGGWTRKFTTLPLPIGPSDKRHINELGARRLPYGPHTPKSAYGTASHESNWCTALIWSLVGSISSEGASPRRDK